MTTVYVPATVRLCAIFDRSPRPIVSATKVGVVVLFVPSVIVALSGTSGTELPRASATLKLGSGLGTAPAVIVTLVDPLGMSCVGGPTTATSGITTENAPAVAVNR